MGWIRVNGITKRRRVAIVRSEQGLKCAAFASGDVFGPTDDPVRKTSVAPVVGYLAGVEGGCEVQGDVGIEIQGMSRVIRNVGSIVDENARNRRAFSL